MQRNEVLNGIINVKLLFNINNSMLETECEQMIDVKLNY